MNYFLDLGTHYLENNNRFSGCESGLSLFEEQLFFGAKAPYDWHILTFEPSAHAFAHNQTVLPSIEKRFAAIRMFNAAIADFDGQMTFKWLPYWSAASTCVMEPLNEISSQYCQEQEVEALDIKRVVKQIIQDIPAVFLYHVIPVYAYNRNKIKSLPVNPYGIINYHRVVLYE